jgi:hypothetical protein
MGYPERPQYGAGTSTTAPLGSSEEEAPDLVSTSSDEDDEDDRLRALPSLPDAGVKISTSLRDSVRTRHMARMDSFNYPDAVICSDGDADGPAAISKLTEALYDTAMEDVADLRKSSSTPPKVGSIGKKNGTPKKVSTRSLRSGVMNQNKASRNDSPHRRRRPSFNTATSADRSPLDTPRVTEDDHLDDDAGAAPTTLASGRDM